jgi:hypothetical protein
MSRLFLVSLGLLLSLSCFAQDLALHGFQKRFALGRNAEGKLEVIRLKKATTRFTIMPFLEQIKADLLNEQRSFSKLSNHEKENQIDEMLMEIGLDPYSKSGADEAQAIKDSLMNLPQVNVEATFRELTKGSFWTEFERRLHEAFLFIDPTIVTNLQDPRFFYKKNVTHSVVTWALETAAKRFSEVPILNIATYVITHVHAMMLEQRSFHHNMLLHYFETIPEADLGMTKEEVDRAVSSIYEYRIEAANILESNKAANDWLNYGMNAFYMQVRAGNANMKSWTAPLSNLGFSNIQKLNFAFASVNHQGKKKIYHLHHKNHMFSSAPSLAYDYSSPNKVKMNRALLNLAGIGVGFLQIPGWIKSGVHNFIKSFYVEQVRMEGALVGHFESTGDAGMIDRIYDQRANFYIVK